MAKARAFFRRLLAVVRRASDAVRRLVTIALLGLVYVVLLPGLHVYLRMRAPRRSGLCPRIDPGVGSLERLRQRQ